MLERARHQAPTYEEVGATRHRELPAGYRHDAHEQQVVGVPDGFPRAREALQHWRAHPGAGTRVFPTDPVTEGATVLLLLRFGPLQIVAPCRIVYVIDEKDRFGFAYGTLPGHPERGEELFVVERRNSGWDFRITAFSRPDQFLVRLGSPVTRRIQLRVTRQYLRSLTRYVTENSSP